MSLRFGVVAVTTLLALLLSPWATAQSAKVRASAGVDLAARLSEVQANPALADNLFKTGRRVAAVCANCHGDGGNSVKPEIPNLADQNPAYMLEQLRQFAEGRRRNEFMEGIIKAMTADEKVGMVLFYSAQKVQHKPVTETALAAQGQTYYRQNCMACHGEAGRGNEKMARVAGQQTKYLDLTLKRYRVGSGVRVDPMMAGSTRTMTDADIQAVIAYVSAMP